MASPAPRGIGTKDLASSLPDSFTHLPLDHDIRIYKKLVERGNAASLSCQQFGVDAARYCHGPALSCAIERMASRDMHRGIFIP